MALVLLRDGRAAMLEALLRIFEPPVSLTARLYKDNLTPNRPDSPDLYILGECTFTGYTRQIIPVWSPVTESAYVASAQAFPVVFQAATPILVGNPVYGYFVSPTDDLSQVLFAERFTSAPYLINTAGQTILLYLTLSEQSVAP